MKYEIVDVKTGNRQCTVDCPPNTADSLNTLMITIESIMGITTLAREVTP